MTTITEEPKTRATRASGHKPKANKASSGAQNVRVAPAKQKSKKNTSRAKKAPGRHKKPDKTVMLREGSKTTQVLELLKRPNGATLRELMNTTNWQAHSIRGFLSGTLGKKMGLIVTSAKAEDGARIYSVKV
jgi:hypothetical protein